jgi:hypothetical protein
MRRILLLLALGGCASAGTPEETTARGPAIYQSKETGVVVGEPAHPTVQTIAASPTAVWLAIKKAHEAFLIPVTVENPPAHQIGNSSFYKTRILAGQPMTNFVNCGSGMNGPKAATYRIYMSLMTVLTADPTGATIVQTTFVPVGQDMSGGSSDRIPCGTTGRFERLFLDQVKAMIVK